MTKYILHGGETKIDCSSNNEFFSMMLGGKGNNDILLVYFSRPKEEWNELFVQDKERLKKLTGHSVNINLASKSDFLNQVNKADTLYFRGGSTESLIDYLKDFELKDIFKDKTIAGSSAGANALGKYYYNNHLGVIKEGLAILPVKIICHFKENDKDKQKLLEKYKEDLEVILLRETEFVIKEVA